MTVKGVSIAVSDEDLLVGFANLGHAGPDELEDLAALRAWARSNGLSAAEAPPDLEDLDLLRAIRRTLQDLMLANNGVATRPDLGPLESLQFRLTFDGGLPGEPRLQAAGPASTTAALAGAVASALVRSVARPTWPRIKACPGPGCAYAFRDTTRNGSRRWCVMSECGNRAKGAAFRARAPRAE